MIENHPFIANILVEAYYLFYDVSYFGSVTLEIIIKSSGLTIGEVVTLSIFI